MEVLAPTSWAPSSPFSANRLLFLQNYFIHVQMHANISEWEIESVNPP